MAEEQHFPARRGPAEDGYRLLFAGAKPDGGRPRPDKRRAGSGNAPRPPARDATGKPRRDTR